MVEMPDGFRPKITVFGKRYTCIDVRTDIAKDMMLILYTIAAPTALERRTPHVATVEDWIQWDQDACNAAAGQPVSARGMPETRSGQGSAGREVECVHDMVPILGQSGFVCAKCGWGDALAEMEGKDG